MDSLKKYFSKVLLFGEYTVLYGGNALATPLKNLHATWEKVISPDETYSSLIRDWCFYIEKHNLPLDTSRILHDWENGRRFVTDIPTGYGLGSSGVLTALFYDLYKTCEVPRDINILKQVLGKIESFFHGQSSGLDPLISYTNQPLLVRQGNVEHVDNIDLQGLNIYLMDSGTHRSTARWVNSFKEKMKCDPLFSRVITTTLKDHVDHAIQICTRTSAGDLSAIISQISDYQRKWWSWMIPPTALSRWDEISSSEKSSIVKFCGAGGGGYFLVFSREDLETEFPYLRKIEL